MNTKKKTIKTILGCTTACSALMLAGFGYAQLNLPKHEISATGVESIPVSISNSNFNSSTSSNYPFSPNSYTAYNQGVKVSSNNTESNVRAGVINLVSEKYETRFALAKRTSLDNYVLMIDSTDEENNSVMHTVNYGYQTNSSIKLDSNSKYMFTVDVFNATNANVASLYLFDSKGEVFSSINNINSYNTWTTYSFFVATNNYESVELKLGMYLEGAGTVLFDNLSAFKLSDNEYEFTKNSFNSNSKVEKNKVDNVIRRFYINNLGQIEYLETDKINSNIKHIEYDLNAETLTSTEQDSDGQNLYAIKIENKDKTFSQYETEDLFTFEANRVYKLSVNVKTKDLDGTASLQLIRTDIDEDDEEYDNSQNKTIKITSNSYSGSTDSVTNDYKTYSFYINSHPSKDLTFKLKFGLGLEDALTSGQMYLSEIEISKINYETFNSASGSDSQKLDFVDAYKDSKIMLDNGDFNAFKIADYNSPIPATPVSWDVTVGKNNQKYGVVNTETFEDDLKSLNLSNLRNPSNSENNNVLMMYNETADTLSYTSTSKSLDANTYHKFEVNVQTQNAPITISLVTKKNDNEVVLTSKTINTNNNWENISLFIHTGYQNLNVSLKLTLNTTGYGMHMLTMQNLTIF